eukprot:1092362-Amorphochlora_amoeboformis.AAC.2
MTHPDGKFSIQTPPVSSIPNVVVAARTFTPDCFDDHSNTSESESMQLSGGRPSPPSTDVPFVVDLPEYSPQTDENSAEEERKSRGDPERDNGAKPRGNPEVSYGATRIMVPDSSIVASGVDEKHTETVLAEERPQEETSEVRDDGASLAGLVDINAAMSTETTIGEGHLNEILEIQVDREAEVDNIDVRAAVNPDEEVPVHGLYPNSILYMH